MANQNKIVTEVNVCRFH
uniref:Uncharacterized protein n=1 Tax=Anguilla anguilla TaxID=7936 RepID=A0A0E9VSF6_ANGAN